jgi:hypothetical protein
MASDGAGLLATLLLMFFGALGAGYIPYFIKVKESQSQLISALGGGLLLGSALAVVIPEGFHAFNQVRKKSIKFSVALHESILT